LEGHKKYVQGVAIHPSMKIIATASADASLRIYKNRKLKNKEEFVLKYSIKTREVADGDETRKK
jgi:WD40 repeat protein